MGVERNIYTKLSKFKADHSPNIKVTASERGSISVLPYKESEYPNYAYQMVLADFKDTLEFEVLNLPLESTASERDRKPNSPYYISRFSIGLDHNDEGDVIGVSRMANESPKVIVELKEINSKNPDNTYRVEYTQVLGRPDVFIPTKVINNNPSNKTGRGRSLSYDRELTFEESEQFLKDSLLKKAIDPVETVFYLMTKDIDAKTMRRNPFVTSNIINE